LDEARANSAQQDGEQGTKDKVIRSFSDVPKFDALLSAGPDAIYPVEPKDRNKYVALSAHGRRAIVLINERMAKTHTEVTAMVGSLTSARYDTSVHLASTEVLAEVYAGFLTGSSTTDDADPKSMRKTANTYMQEAGRWIAYGVEQGATDIHLEIKGSKGYVRVRVDGELEALRLESNGVYPSQFIEKVMGSLYNNEQQRKSGSNSSFEAESSLYCMVPYAEIPGHGLKLRYQSMPGNEGPKVVLRLLNVDESAKTLTYKELGYETSQERMWRSATRTPSGAVLIAGVTGSGKSTTQKSFIELNPAAKEMAIFTIEDPVEYPIAAAHQIPLQRDLSNPDESAKAYATTVSSLMRMDPDIVMLGEVRDLYSARALQQLAETGHMALATVHAHLISGITSRLTNEEIGMSRDVLAAPNMLTLLVYQALVPKLCPHCALESHEAAGHDEDIDSMISVIKRLGLDPRTFRWKRPGGCQYCNHRGTKGQTVVAEMLMPDEDWLRHLREGRDDLALNVYRSHSDMNLLSNNMVGKTVFEHALLKAANGLTDARQCSRFDNPDRFANRYLRLQKSI
jgi:type II secretory ATPase GspE/PulE/Tfp pilus assembly ATPase PilB-like protein